MSGSFWSTSTGEDLAQTEAPKEYETPGTSMEPIPDGSTVLAYVKEAKWDKNQQGDRYVKLRWDVMEPESVKKRVVFQKLWVKDPDPNAKDPDAKRDKALRMLATIDANAGGKLAKKGTDPTDDELLIALANKPMAITVKIWEMGDASGNWVAAVSPKGKELVVKGGAAATAKTAEGKWDDDVDSDIPF